MQCYDLSQETSAFVNPKRVYLDLDFHCINSAATGPDKSLKTTDMVSCCNPIGQGLIGNERNNTDSVTRATQWCSCLTSHQKAVSGTLADGIDLFWPYSCLAKSFFDHFWSFFKLFSLKRKSIYGLKDRRTDQQNNGPTDGQSLL